MSSAETAVDHLLAAISSCREWEFADDAFARVRDDCAASVLGRFRIERAVRGSSLSPSPLLPTFSCKV